VQKKGCGTSYSHAQVVQLHASWQPANRHRPEARQLPAQASKWQATSDMRLQVDYAMHTLLTCLEAAIRLGGAFAADVCVSSRVANVSFSFSRSSSTFSASLAYL